MMPYQYVIISGILCKHVKSSLRAERPETHSFIPVVPLVTI